FRYSFRRSRSTRSYSPAQPELPHEKNIMTNTIHAGATRQRWLLLPLLAASGCAALIYEVVWFQLLQLVIGASAISLGLLLAAYMGGLCLGSATLGRVVSPRRNPLMVYAFLELGVGI